MKMSDGEFTTEELLSGYDPAAAQERYDDKKAQTLSIHYAGKFLGKPHSASAQKSLKKLTPKHYKMIAMHLRGKSNTEIAQEIGCTQTTTWKVLNSPLSRQIIEEFYEAHKVDLMGLFSPCN